MRAPHDIAVVNGAVELSFCPILLLAYFLLYPYLTTIDLQNVLFYFQIPLKIKIFTRYFDMATGLFMSMNLIKEEVCRADGA
jgi:hypothetical protein